MHPTDDRTAHRLRSLERWNSLWVTLLCLGALGIAGRVGLEQQRQARREFTCRRTAEGLTIASMHDGPAVVTHLCFRGGSTAEKRIVHLREPLTIIDSEGAWISSEGMRNLRWRDFRGEPASAPPDGAPLTAWYYEPETSR